MQARFTMQEPSIRDAMTYPNGRIPVFIQPRDMVGRHMGDARTATGFREEALHDGCRQDDILIRYAKIYLKYARTNCSRQGA